MEDEEIRADAARVKANPWQPETNPLRLALLGKLGEELGECGAATSRCIIQGISEREPMTNKLNRNWLTDEIGDVLAGIDEVTERFGLDRDRIERRRASKRAHLQSWHEQIDIVGPAIEQLHFTHEADHPNGPWTAIVGRITKRYIQTGVAVVPTKVE